MKYIPADKLKAEIEKLKKEARKNALIARDNDNTSVCTLWSGKENVCTNILSIIDSFQQDKDTLDLCSQVWWEDRGWIMIPPNVTLKGIESLLEKVRHKIKWNEENGIEEQEQPEVDLENYLENYFKGWHVEEEIGLTKPDGWSCIVCDLKGIARHFYELGLNARKP